MREAIRELIGDELKTVHGGSFGGGVGGTVLHSTVVNALNPTTHPCMDNLFDILNPAPWDPLPSCGWV
jgi:hypothetical protein